MELNLRCFEKDLQYIEPIIFMQEYRTKPEVEFINLNIIDGNQIRYKIEKLKEAYVFVEDVS